MGRCCRSISGSNKDNMKSENPTIKEVYLLVGGEQENEETNWKASEGNRRSTCWGWSQFTIE